MNPKQGKLKEDQKKKKKTRFIAVKLQNTKVKDLIHEIFSSANEKRKKEKEDSLEKNTR